MNEKIKDYKLRVAAHNLDNHLVDCIAFDKMESVEAWADDILTTEEIEEAIVEALRRKKFVVQYPEEAGQFPEPLADQTRLGKLRSDTVDEIIVLVKKAEGAVLKAERCAFNGRVITFDYNFDGIEPQVVIGLSVASDELVITADGWDRESGCAAGSPQDFYPENLDTDTLNEILEMIK